MEILAIAALCAALFFMVLVILGAIKPSWGFAKTRKDAFVKNFGLAFASLIVMVWAIPKDKEGATPPPSSEVVVEQPKPPAVEPPKQPEKTEAEKAAEYEACKQDIQCWGDKHTFTAGIDCDDHVERLAKYSYEWTDGMLEPKFSRFRWRDKGKGHVTYIGDKIKFQNGFGAWQNYIYECDLDPENDRVLDVRARPGRL